MRCTALLCLGGGGTGDKRSDGPGGVDDGSSDSSGGSESDSDSEEQKRHAKNIANKKSKTATLQKCLSPGVALVDDELLSTSSSTNKRKRRARATVVHEDEDQEDLLEYVSFFSFSMP